jgi:hypothetical protein
MEKREVDSSLGIYAARRARLLGTKRLLHDRRPVEGRTLFRLMLMQQKGGYKITARGLLRIEVHLNAVLRNQNLTLDLQVG